MKIHNQYMQRALFLALFGIEHTAPNPMVGAVLVYNDEIIGEGWHQKFGEEHAEVNCIKSVKEADKHKIGLSTLYITLEPCAHYGKTPPCSLFIIENKIPKVVIACIDTFSKVSGKGIEMLKNAGIEVVLGVLESEARELNKRFFTFNERERPYIILKWAQSADGFIAPENGKKVMISNALVQRYVHKMRNENTAILVGFKTALLDNPMLSNRFFGTFQPLRIVIDINNELPKDLLLKNDNNQTWIFNAIEEKKSEHCSFIKLKNDTNYVPEILSFLFQNNINSLIVEGGTKTLESFIDSGFWDEAHVVNAKTIIEKGVKAPQLKNEKLIQHLKLEDNDIFVFENVNKIAHK